MSDVISSIGESPNVRGEESRDQMGRGNGEPIDGNKVVLTVNLPHEDPGIISGPGWSPKR